MSTEAAIRPTPNLLGAYAVAAVAVVIWAGSPAATQFTVNEIHPVLAGILRTVLAAAIAVPVVLIGRFPLPRGRNQWGLLAVSSLVGFTAFPFIYTIGISMTSTAHAALILAGLPAVTGLVGAAFERRLPGRVWFAGIAIAMIGEAILIGSSGSSGEATIEGDLICVLATLCSGTGYVTGSRLAPHVGAWGANFWALLMAGALQVPLLFMLPMSVDWVGLTPVGWGGLLYLVFLVGILGYTAWYWALSKGGVVRMAPVQFAQPLVSLLIAVALFSETMTTPLIAAAVLILAGIIIARKGT